jgi:hypothetical protein
MSSLRVLITNNTLADRAGSELYVRDLALALLKRGHRPIAYSMTLGEVAEELRAATIPVVSDLSQVGSPPDIIHGHHHYETMTALLHFPGTPALSFCHAWQPWQETPPAFPRILRYIAVDETCRDRLVLENGVPEDRVTLLLNFVDLERFKARPPLPPAPKRALVFGNTLDDGNGLSAIRAACRSLGISLDVAGLAAGNPVAHPEDALPSYDLVFAKARCALESLAVGAAVVLCDAAGMGGMVTSANFDQSRRFNFGVRTLTRRLDAVAIAEEISRYDAADASTVSCRVRQEAGVDDVVDRLIALYASAIDEFNTAARPAESVELRAAAAYLRQWGPKFKEWPQATRVSILEREVAVLRSEQTSLLGHLRSEQASLGHHVLARVRSVTAKLFPPASLRGRVYNRALSFLTRQFKPD